METDAGGCGGGFWPTGCEKCGCISFSQEWYKAFGIMICVNCRQNDNYRLISKGNAKSTYLLTDNDLKNLGCITKENPQKKAWSAMKLYLQSQVEEVGRRKHGTEEDIQAARQQRLDAKITSRVMKRRIETQGSTREQEAIEKTKQRLLEEYHTEKDVGSSCPEAEVEEI